MEPSGGPQSDGRKTMKKETQTASPEALKIQRRKRAVLRSVLAAKGDVLAGYREYADCIYNIKTLLMAGRASIIDIVRAAEGLDEDRDLAGAIAADIEALGFAQKGGAK